MSPLSHDRIYTKPFLPQPYPETPTNQPRLQLTRATHLALLPDDRLRSPLHMLLANERTLVERLITRRHIQRGILIEEIHRPHHHLDDLARHDRKVLDAGDMVETEGDPDDQIGVLDVVPAVGPGAHAGAAARLVGVLAAGVELAVAVAGDVEVVVGELGAFVVEAVRVGEHFLEGGGVDLVADGLAVDGVADGGVLDLEGSVGVVVDVDAAGFVDHRLFHHVARSLRVQRRARHGVGFVVDESVVVPVDCGVDAEGEDVLVVGCEYAWVDDCAPRNLETFVNGLRAENTGGADFVNDISSLIEHECKNVFVIGDGDDGLNYKLSVPYDSGPSGSVVGVLPADASILFVNAHNILHGLRLSLVVRKYSTEVVNRTETVAAELQIVSHNSCSSISEVEGCLSVEWRSWIGVWNIHIRERKAIEQAPSIIANLKLLAPRFPLNMWLRAYIV